MAAFSEAIVEQTRRAVLEDMLRSLTFTHGSIFHVIAPADTNLSALQQMYGMKNVFTTLETAYDACTTNCNDVIFLHGQGYHDLAAGIAWSKNRVHVIGLDGGDRLVQQGARVRLVTAATSAYVVKVTGVRNTFRNVKFIQAATAATGLHVMEEGGEGNAYVNCSFVFEVADNLDLTTATEVLCGSDSASYIKCVFGNDTLLTSGARSVFTIDQVTTSQEFKSNMFEDCVFMISSSEATAYLLSVAAAGDVLFTNLFKNCIFMASVDSAGGVALTNAVTSIASLVKGTLNFYMPASFNCTNFSANNSTAFKVFAPAASNNAFESVTPA